MTFRVAQVVLTVGAIVSAYMLGLGNAPTREVEKLSVLRTVKRVEVDRVQASIVDIGSTDVVKGKVRTVWYYPPTPECPKPVVASVRTEDPVATHGESKKAIQASSEAAVFSSNLESLKQSREVVRAAPRYSVGLDGTIVFKDQTSAAVRGRFAIRALGPLWIGAVAEPQTKRYGVTAGWTW